MAKSDLYGEGSRRLRADAQRNYEKLLEVAATAFEEFGAEAALEDIARRADVSIATLYRHFPTRQDLVEAIYLRVADSLRDEANRLLAAPDPWEALLTWLRSQLQSGAFGRGLAASVMSTKLTEGSTVNTSTMQMKHAGQALLDRAVAACQAKPNIDLGDLLMVIHGIVLANEQVPTSLDRPERMLAVVVNGLRA
jgi:AcrR family transcriptional regulator